MNVIGIYSRAFCGSTITMRMLTCLPNTAAVGEAFRLLEPVQRSRHCALCGMARPCPVFTHEFLSKRFSPHDLYRQLSSHLGPKKTLVSSDKAPESYEQCLGKRRLDAVVLVRSPLAVVLSDMERSLRFKRLDSSLRFYTERFSKAESWAKEWSRRYVIVALESLLKHPQDVLSEVAKAFGMDVPTVPDDLSSLRVHAIAGNGTAYTSKKLNPKDRWRTLLSPKVQERVTAHQAMRIYERLLSKSVVPL
jgi:hypothetical protein